MPSKEFFHTLEQYQKHGWQKFLDHIQDYVSGTRHVPVSKANSTSGQSAITFTFSDELLKKLLEREELLKKPYEVAIKYGFRGYSKGGKNGLFYQRREDQNMITKTSRLIHEFKPEIIKDLDINEQGLDCLQKVKVVWHNPSGERLVGVYNPYNQRMILLDFVTY